MSEANVPHRYDSPGDRPPSQAADAQDWTPVPFPGAAPIESVTPPDDALRETELLNLIRDLNQCNEALLGRVHQLEQSLETTQQALQGELERAHPTAHPSAEEQMAMAQQRSTAQLLSELETANDALKRQRILSETLQVQLDSSQERVGQLERDCAQLQQRQTEQTQALLKSEDLCRDLRSRLQRQQQYTLQFKAALEKCLDMNTHSNSPEPPAVAAAAMPRGAGETPGNPVTMPKATRIQPWSLWEGEESGPALDPQLRSLLRTVASSHADHPAAPGPSPTSPQTEADDRLWQDLEMVIEQSLDPAVEGLIEEEVEEFTPSSLTHPLPEDGATARFTEPSPWGSPQPRDPAPADTVDGAAGPAEWSAAMTPEHPMAPPWQSLDTSMPTYGPQGQPPGWGEPYRPQGTTPGGAVPEPTADRTADRTVDVQASPGEADSPLPIFTPGQFPGTAPSPLVHPLRPSKKKRSSLSAVELPSFPPLSRTSQ